MRLVFCKTQAISELKNISFEKKVNTAEVSV